MWVTMPSARRGLGARTSATGRAGSLTMAGGRPAGQDLGAGRRDGDRVFGVGGTGAVGGADRPAVLVEHDFVGGAAEPGLDGDREAGVEWHAAVGPAVVGDVRGFVHGTADAVATELAVHAVPVGVGDLADRGRDVA